MTTSNEIRNWKKKADAGDAESAFLIYITHTDPATGAPQDWDTAWRYLNIAFESGHPDATLVMGTVQVWPHEHPSSTTDYSSAGGEMDYSLVGWKRSRLCEGVS